MYPRDNPKRRSKLCIWVFTPMIREWVSESCVDSPYLFVGDVSSHILLGPGHIAGSIAVSLAASIAGTIHCTMNCCFIYRMEKWPTPLMFAAMSHSLSVITCSISFWMSLSCFFFSHLRMDGSDLLLSFRSWRKLLCSLSWPRTGNPCQASLFKISFKNIFIFMQIRYFQYQTKKKNLDINR